ncbi:MAG: glutaredoxin family protein [Gammaproteobacteria bacterium]|nr:glutaredoxin family protein [Gammaproteobacteria bacterium]
MTSVHRLTVYERAGCHLCDDMVSTLSEWKTELGFEMERVDVDGSPELAARYGAKVPVLMHGTSEICHFFLDLDALRRSLDVR